jgi:hypothetical protein
MNLKQTVRTGVSEMHTGINDFKKGYQPRTNMLKDEQGDLVAYPPQYYG